MSSKWWPWRAIHIWSHSWKFSITLTSMSGEIPSIASWMVSFSFCVGTSRWRFSNNVLGLWTNWKRPFKMQLKESRPTCKWEWWKTFENGSKCVLHVKVTIWTIWFTKPNAKKMFVCIHLENAMSLVIPQTIFFSITLWNVGVISAAPCT